MKEYEKIINKSNSLQNSFALNILLENGRRKLLNDDSYKNIVNEISNSTNGFMSAEYAKEVLEIAKNMAKLDDKALSAYIYDKVKEEKKQERNR